MGEMPRTLGAVAPRPKMTGSNPIVFVNGGEKLLESILYDATKPVWSSYVPAGLAVHIERREHGGRQENVQDNAFVC